MIEAARGSWTAFSSWCLVIWVALPHILARSTRGSKVMFLLYLLEPLLLVSAFYAVRGILRQNQPNYGTSLFLFYASGLLPFYLFLRVSARTRAASTAPSSLLPGATALDVYISTALLEALINVITTVLVFAGMWLYGIEQARPASIVDCAAVMAIFLFLGMGVGMINNVIYTFVPFWLVFYRVCTRGLIFLSGIIIIVDFTPVWLRSLIVMNPLAHGVDWFRLGVYGRYPANFLDKSYLLEFTLITLFLGFVLDRAALRVPNPR